MERLMFNKENDCKLTREQIDERAQTLLAQMTLKEKVWMLNGNWDTLWNMVRHKNA